MSRTREDYESVVARIVGCKLEAVHYYEIAYETNKPCYELNLHVGHFLDFGLNLTMSNGEQFGFIWDGEFYQYGVGIMQHSLSAEVDNARVWDVTSHKNWSPLIGREIINAKTYWSWAQHIEEKERYYFPQDIELQFNEGSCIYISASSYMSSSDTLIGMCDEISVIFDKEKAKKFRVWSFSSNG
jgi:hypothetical protein